MFSSRTVRRARRRGGVALAAAMVVSLAAGLGLVAPVPVYAAGETLQVVLGQTDGTPEWTGTGPGLDAGDKNGIIRTNDNIKYSVDVNSNGGTASNTKITLKLPQGVQFDSVPGLCTGPGTKLTPNPMPAPAANLTSTSWQSLPQQTLVCDIGTVTSGSTRTFDLVARVRPEVPNGSKLPGITASVTSDAVTTPVVSNRVDDLTVSARAQYDLSKNSTALTPDSGYYYSSYQACTKSEGLCRYMTFPMLLSAPIGGKGISPLAGTFTFTDDVSPEALFGSAVLSDPDYVAAGANAAKTYGAALVGCASQKNTSFGASRSPASGRSW